MAEQHRPVLADPVVETDPALRGLRGEIRRRVVDPEAHGHLPSLFEACRPKMGTGFGTSTCDKTRAKARNANLKDRDPLFALSPSR